MANLNAAFSELRQALQTVDNTWVQLAAQNAIHSWPHGACPGQLLRGAMVALQNGVVGVVAPSQDASEIRVLTGVDNVAVSFEEASEGKLSAIAQLALSADGLSSQPLADSTTGQKLFLSPDFGGPRTLRAQYSRTSMFVSYETTLPFSQRYATPYP